MGRYDIFSPAIESKIKTFIAIKLFNNNEYNYIYKKASNAISSWMLLEYLKELPEEEINELNKFVNPDKKPTIHFNLSRRNKLSNPIMQFNNCTYCPYEKDKKCFRDNIECNSTYYRLKCKLK